MVRMEAMSKVTKGIRVIPAMGERLQTEKPTEPMAESTTSPLRVAAYCRVSTGEKDQQNSYRTQIRAYREMIRSNVNWRLVGIYADEGISGTQTKKRKDFRRMMRAARRGKIDLILCKSISRFARNTVDLLDAVRELKGLGVAVIFEKENINTGAIDSEFILSLYASFAQAESESISRNITWGIEKSFRDGHVRFSYHQMLGYRRGADGLPEIVEEEAEVVREIYRHFTEGRSMGEIANDLTRRSVPRRSGSCKWTRKNVEQILQNEKYAGFAILQKTYTVDCLTHARAVNNGERPKYIVENSHPAIVSREIYEKAQEEFRRRSDAWKEKCAERERAKQEHGTDGWMCESGTRYVSGVQCEGGTRYNYQTDSKLHDESEGDDTLKPCEDLDAGFNHDPSCFSIDVSLEHKSHETRPTYIWNRLLLCPWCGGTFRRVIWKSNGRRYAVWRCGNRLEGGKARCAKGVSIHEDQLWESVWKRLEDAWPELKECCDEETRENALAVYTKRVIVFARDRVEVELRGGI